MADSVGSAKLAISADTSGVEAGVGKARRSLATLGQSSDRASAQMVAGSKRASQAIDQQVARLQLSAATMGKTASQARLFELAQRGATREQLQAASAALRSVDAFKQQEAAAARTAQAAQLAGRLVATAFVAAAAGAVLLARNSINALDNFNDLADATGASIEGISALDRIARENGATFETVAGTLTKFNQALNATDEEGQKAGQVFKALGLNAAELKRLDPAEALRQTAVSMAKFADNGDKARAVQLLFGRSVQEVAPLLKDLSNQTELVGTTSTKAAQDAETFNKHLFALRANTGDLARSLVGDLLPALNRVMGAMRQPGGMMGFLFSSGADTKDPGKALADISDKLRKLRADREALDPAKGTRNKVNDFLFGDVADIDRQISALEKKQTFLKNLQASDAVAGAGDTSDALSRRLQPRGARGIGAIPEGTKNGSGKDPLADTKQYLQTLQKQLQGTRDLTVYETLLDDIQSKRIEKVTPELQQQLETTARLIDAAKEQARALADQSRAREQASKMQQAADEAAQQSADQLMASNEILRQDIELIGAEGTARAAIEQARISSTIALKEEALAMMQNAEASAAQIGGLEREIALLRERRELLGTKGTREASEEARKKDKEFTTDLQKDLEGAFTAAMTHGTANPLKAFGEALYRTVLSRLSAALAEALAKQVIEGLLGGGGGVPPNPFAGGGGGGGLIGSLVSLFVGLFHEGGVVGSGSPARRAVNPAVFAGAKRYHSGGLAGDEEPAILLRGERVLSRKETSAYDAGLAGRELLNVGGRQFQALGGAGTQPQQTAGSGAIHIVNNLSEPIGKVTEQTTTDGDRVLVLERAMVEWLADPNSRVSRTLATKTTASRRR